MSQTDNKSIQLPVLTKFTKHPANFVNQLIKLSIYQTYGLDFPIKITRQSRAIKESDISFIDYSYACFELAGVIDKDPEKVAQVIAKNAQKWIKQTHPALVDSLHVDTVGGYVNFELSDSYLAESVYYVARWLHKPETKAIKSRTIHFLIFNSLNMDGSFSLESEVTYKFLSDIFEVAGMSVKKNFIVPDASENAVQSISYKLWQKSDEKNEQRDLRDYQTDRFSDISVSKQERKVLRILSGIHEDKKLEKKINDIQNSYVESLAKELKDHGISLKLRKETDRVKKVQKWLDGLPRKMHRQGLVADPMSKAVYYHMDAGLIAPLRSAIGSLFEAAYILHSVYQLSDKLKTDKNSQLLVVCHQKSHQLIKSLMGEILPESANKRLVCVDPKITRAALVDHDIGLDSLDRVLNSIAHTLALTISRNGHKEAKTRQKIIRLLDAPVEFTDFATQAKPQELAVLLITIIEIVKDLQEETTT